MGKEIIIGVVVCANGLVSESEQLKQLCEPAEVRLVFLGAVALGNRHLGSSVVHAGLETIKAGIGVVGAELMSNVPPELCKKEGVEGVMGDPEGDSRVGLRVVSVVWDTKTNGHREVIRVSGGFLGCVSGVSKVVVVSVWVRVKDGMWDGGDVGVGLDCGPVSLAVGDVEPI